MKLNGQLSKLYFGQQHFMSNAALFSVPQRPVKKKEHYNYGCEPKECCWSYQ